MIRVFASPFIGRRRDVAALRELVSTRRLVTLTGAGGSGKTRLAFEVAADVPRFRDGVRAIELVDVVDPAVVPHTALSALGGRQSARPDVAAVSALLADVDALVIVDNCEHLIDACAELVSSMVTSCPRVSVLATSREPLGVEGEEVWPVRPLSLPASGRPATAASLADSDAAQLFVQRARAAAGRAALTDGDADAIARICRRLDGIPLAIELAAARVRVLPVSEIAARLEKDLGVLDSPARRGTARHRTLNAAIEWSYTLLGNDERALLRRLAVFGGELDPEAVEAVCGGGAVPTGETFALLARLVDKSLVELVRGADRPRYRLLEMVRQFAARQLADTGEWEACAEAFAGHVASRLRSVNGPHSAEFGSATCDRANVRAALVYALGEPRLHPLALGIVGRMWPRWIRLGVIGEARGWAERALATSATGLVRAEALTAAGVFAWLLDELGDARDRFAAAMREAGGDDAGIVCAATAASFASQVELALGQLDRAQELAQRGVDELRGGAAPWHAASAFINAGNVARGRGELDAAAAVYEQALEQFRDLADDWSTAMALRNLGITAFLRGDNQRAIDLLRDSLLLCARANDPWFASRGLESLGEVLVAEGHAERAAEMFGAGESLRQALGVSVLEVYRASYDAAVTAARAALTPERFDDAWQRGRDMSMNEAIDAVAQTTRTATPTEPSLRVWSLGSIAVEVDGAAPTTRDALHGKPYDLFAYLLCHGPQTREQIGAALWPESPPAQVRNSLGVALHRLRRGLGRSSTVLFHNGRYEVATDPPYWFDATELARSAALARDTRKEASARLEGAETALALYVGEFMVDRGDDEWIARWRERLRCDALDAAVIASELRLATGDAEAAIRHARAAIVVDPYREAACRSLMRALVAAGETAGALRAFATLKARLAEDLGVEPAPETSALADAIRCGASI